MEFTDWWSKVVEDTVSTGLSLTYSVESVRLLCLKAWYDARFELLNNQIAANLSKLEDSKRSGQGDEPPFMEPNASAQMALLVSDDALRVTAPNKSQDDTDTPIHPCGLKGCASTSEFNSCDNCDQ